MDTQMAAKKGLCWFGMAFFLYLPFVLELPLYPLFMQIEPQWLGIALFQVGYTYVFYGAAIVIYHKWRKKRGFALSWKPAKWLYIVIALVLGAIFRRIEFFAIGHSQTPMLIRELGYAIRTKPEWLGYGGFALQFIYYIFEFALTACIVDCAQNACESYKLPKAIPWGGLFLGLTWGLEHIVTQELSTGISCLLLSVLMGIAYIYAGRKPICAFAVVFAAYLL